MQFLCEKALEETGFRWDRPQYPEEEYADEAEADEAADAGSDIEDEIAGADDEEEEVLYTEIAHVGGGEEDTSTQGILESKVDPKAWQKELERVGPRLKVRAPPVGKEWRGHIESTKKHEEVGRFSRSAFVLVKRSHFTRFADNQDDPTRHAGKP